MKDNKNNRRFERCYDDAGQVIELQNDENQRDKLSAIIVDWSANGLAAVYVGEKPYQVGDTVLHTSALEKEIEEHFMDIGMINLTKSISRKRIDYKVVRINNLGGNINLIALTANA